MQTPKDNALIEAERAELRVLMRAPALWPLQIVAGELGLDAAVEACREPTSLPANVRALLVDAAYDPASCLPLYSDVRALLVGARVRAAQKGAGQSRDRTRPKPKPEPLVKLATRLGYNLKDVQDSLRIVRLLCGTEAHR
jgi:hypothetical protein